MYRAAIGLCLLLVMTAAAGCAGSPDEAERPEVSLAPIVSPTAAAYLIDAQEAFQRADFGLALALADSAAQHAGTKNPAFLADVSFLRARVYTELNRSDQARAAYEQVLARKPGYRGAWLNLGNDAFRQGRYSEALTYYRREQELHPDPRTHVYVGRAYAELGQDDSARYAYERALEADDSLAEAYIRLSQLYDGNGEPEEALSYALRALELEKNDPGYRYLVGLLLLRTGQPEEALQHLTAVVQQRPHDHEVHYNLGQALVRLGRPEQARPHLAAADSLREVGREVTEWKTLTHLHPEDPAVWATYGYALRQTGQDAEAVRAYNVALHLDPENTDIRFELANLYLQHGALNDALTHYQTILQQDSTLAGTWLNAGIAYARAGRTAEARRAWQQALQYRPDHPQAKAYLARLDQTP